MNPLKRFGLSCGIGVLNCTYTIMKISPTRNKVTFISRQSNKPTLDMRLLAAEITREHPDTQVVMLPKRLENHLSYSLHMLRQIHHIATSKVVILDSYCMAISLLDHKPDLQVIQMWHAIGSMKKFGYAMIGQPEGWSQEIADIMKMHRGYTDVLISSMDFVKDFEEGFHVTRDMVHEAPLPRVDRLLDVENRESQRQTYLKRYPQLAQKKNILYCPTFRKESSEEVSDRRNQELNVERFFSLIDYTRYNLIYRPHPLDRHPIVDDHVMTIPGSTLDLLCIADYVVSDYSSVIYEAGLLDIPVYLYAYDWDVYRNRRQLNIDLEHDTPFVFSSDARVIVDQIENGSFDMLALRAFMEKNVRIPKGMTCCEKILTLMRI